MRPWPNAAASASSAFLPKITRGFSAHGRHFPVSPRLVAWHGRAVCQRQKGRISSTTCLIATKQERAATAWRRIPPNFTRGISACSQSEVKKGGERVEITEAAND